MSLFGSMQMAGNSLRATQIGLQVAGQNIANANTPGYIREEVILSPSTTQRLGGLLLGTGVTVEAVVQKIDNFLEGRLRGATSDRAGGEVQEEIYKQLEGLAGDLSDTSIGSSLNDFFSSINDVLNQPESTSVRNLTVLKGKTLAEDISRLATRVGQMRIDLNAQVDNAAGDINTLIDQIRSLNVRIASTEGGDISASDAVGLRDQRKIALTKLSEIMSIRVEEQKNGGVAIFAGGDYLVYDSQVRHVKTVSSTDRGLTVSTVQMEDTNSDLEITSGRLKGLTNARDDVLGGYLDKLDTVARTLTFEFNKVFASGQGLTGYSSLTSEFAVDDTTVPLDAAGLSYTPVNGSFQIQVFNRHTGLTQTSTISVDLNGLERDTSLADLAASIDAIDGVSASISSTRQLTITSDDPDQELAFAQDSSGILAALGLNTFFSGTSARSIGVNRAVLNDASKFAASRGGIGKDTDTGVDLAVFIDRPLDSMNGETLGGIYDRLTAETTQGSTVASAVAEGFRTYEQTLNGQSLATTGVNLDEEAIKMISFQRVFQASAKYIATLSELLEVLVNL